MHRRGAEDAEIVGISVIFEVLYTGVLGQIALYPRAHKPIS
jgi:hypothetical protein